MGKKTSTHSFNQDGKFLESKKKNRPMIRLSEGLFYVEDEHR